MGEASNGLTFLPLPPSKTVVCHVRINNQLFFKGLQA